MYSLLAQAEVDVTDWKVIVATVLSTLITAFLIPYLKNKASAARATASAQSIQAVGSSIATREVLREELKAFMFDTAASISEKRFPDLARRVAEGKLTNAKDIKDELKGWGENLKTDAVLAFKAGGIDLAAELGDVYLDSVVEWAANRVSPFPGKETAVALLQEKASDALIKYGVDYMRKHADTVLE